MENETPATDFQFMQLVLSLHAAAMQQMGKTQSPITGKIERDLPMCKNTIDMLEMLERKTKGNLVEDETKILERVLFECRMNFVEEAKKDNAEPGDQAKADSDSGQTESGPDADSESGDEKDQ